MVKWSVCSYSTPTIRVRSLLTSTVIYLKFVFEKNENKQKRGRGLAHFKKMSGPRCGGGLGVVVARFPIRRSIDSYRLNEKYFYFKLLVPANWSWIICLLFLLNVCSVFEYCVRVEERDNEIVGLKNLTNFDFTKLKKTPKTQGVSIGEASLPIEVIYSNVITGCQILFLVKLYGYLTNLKTINGV